MLVAELALGFLGSVKLGEEGLRGYGKAHAVIDGFLDVTVDFWRKIHYCCSNKVKGTGSGSVVVAIKGESDSGKTLIGENGGL